MDILKSRLSQIPMLRLLAPFVIGILSAILFNGIVLISCTVTFSFLILLIAWSRFNAKNAGYKSRWIFGALTGLFLVSAGYSVTLLRQPDKSKYNYCRYLHGGADTLVATINSQPSEKEKTIKASAEITGVVKNGKVTGTRGQALLYFAKDSLAHLIRYGDVLTLRTAMLPLKPPSNPDEFDYKSYLYRHGMEREAYLHDNSWSFIGSKHAEPLIAFAALCRNKMAALLNEKIKGTEAALASAILLGYRDDLPQPLIQQFADSGVIHVICVAGLHVGILFGIIAWLLSPLDKIQAGKYIRLVITLALLWFYAVLTGLSTPVVRAVVIFSFLYAGRCFGRYSNSMNNLAASALLLLLFNPLSVADTGFQLSYLSVAGIIVLYPMFYRLLELNNSIVNRIWEFTCLSISAQLAIAPISIAYFHQFPNYFVFTNLIIVPLLGLAVCAGLLFFATFFIPYVKIITALFLQKVLGLMNYLVVRMHHLPLFSTKNISLSIPEVILLYCIILSLISFSVYKEKRLLFIALFGLIILLTGRVWQEYTRNSQQIFTVYDIPGHSAVSFVSGRQGLLLQPVDSLNFCMHIKNNWCREGVADTGSMQGSSGAVLLSGHLYLQSDFAQFNSMPLAFVRNGGDMPRGSRALKIKYLVLSGGYRLNISALQNAYIFDELIFDSSISEYRRKKWEDECERLHIRYYDVAASGAFVKKLAG